MKYSKTIYIFKYTDNWMSGTYYYSETKRAADGTVYIGCGVLSGELIDDTRDAEIEALEKDLADKAGKFEAYRKSVMDKIQSLRSLKHKA